MSGYTALPSLTSPDGASTAPPLPNGFDDPHRPGVRERVATWWKESVGWGSPPSPPPPPSNYLTLIPLSDARLQPRDTRITVASLAHIEGDLRVLFYKTEAGKQSVGSVKLPARSSPAMVDVTIDASDVPSDYILAILSQCSTFPEVLIFFLQGNLTARYLFQRQHLTAIDTYFLIDCRNGGGVAPSFVNGTPDGTYEPGAQLADPWLQGLEPGWC